MTKDYYGIKRVTAWPEHRNGVLAGEIKEGYAVKYADGYISWSPKGVFEAAYEPTDWMSFPAALQALKEGHRVARWDWNGKGMFIFLVDGSRFTVNREPLLSILGEGAEVNYRPHIDIRAADGSIAVWAPSQTDMMAADWQIVHAKAEG